ncbi:MAG: hypothetical protein GX180_12075 [Enterococcus sp.]|nr:hypothetical protein [Enterococcus sp.]
MKLKHLFIAFVFALGVIFSIIICIAFLGFLDARTVNTWTPVTIIPGPKEFNHNMEGIIALHNPAFSVLADYDGLISISDHNGKSIISRLFYYASPDMLDEIYGLENAVPALINDSTILINGSGINGADVSVWLTTCQISPKLDIKVQTTYSADTEVAREALIGQFELPVSEVFKKNRTLDKNAFKSEYWLDRQGVKFSDGERQVLIYHTPGISSLQLDHQKNILLINLEYANDHPYIFFPFQDDNGGNWIDQSNSIFLKDFVRTDSLSIWFGDLPVEIPRLMMLPEGYLAGYVFTEHADGGTIDAHRAVYFGCDTIKCEENAIGGFWGNKIPVTKSVFYVDKENPVSCSAIHNNLRDCSFLEFLLQLHSTGFYDICLHTPENMNSDRIMMNEASAFMREKFASTTWIDHGMLGGRNNRECFHADAFDSNSEFFAADIWEKYGVKYFWNTAYEFKEPFTSFIRKELKQFHLLKASQAYWAKFLTFTEIDNVSFLQALLITIKKLFRGKNLNLIEYFRNEALPMPLFWKHPSRTHSFISWGTHFVNNYRDLWTDKAEDRVREEKVFLENLIRNRTVFINHGYYVRGISGLDLTSHKDGEINLNQYFDKILKYMSQRRDDGDLLILTIKDLLDYQLLQENIIMNYTKEGIIITNNNDKPVKNLSLGMRHAGILLNGSEPKSRIHDGERIFWFDIQANESVFLKIIQEIDLTL